MFEAMGIEAFSEPTRRELRAAGERRARKRRVSSQGELTAPEAQVAKLAREGLSNPGLANHWDPVTTFHPRSGHCQSGPAPRLPVAKTIRVY
jgi:hypothetical protein